MSIKRISSTLNAFLARHFKYRLTLSSFYFFVLHVSLIIKWRCRVVVVVLEATCIFARQNNTLTTIVMANIIMQWNPIIISMRGVKPTAVFIYCFLISDHHHRHAFIIKPSRKPPNRLEPLYFSRRLYIYD